MTQTPPTDNRRRIALVTTELGVGGAEQCLTQIALRLPADRFQTSVISLAPPPAPPRDLLVRRLAEAGVETRFVGVSRRRQLWTALRTLESWFREERPDLVQSFLFHANVVCGHAVRRAGVRRWVTGWRVADPRLWRPRLERFLTRRADRVACVSQRVARQAQSVGVDSNRIVVIPNGVDVARFAAAAPVETSALGVAPGRKVLLSIGRLDLQKGFDWLLEQMPRLLSQLPDHDWVVVGEGPQRESLEQQAMKLGVARRVHWVGWQPDTARLLAAASLVLLPSRWEGMPNVLLEAMASGLEVVATRVEGVTELLGDEAEAQSAELGDEEGFAARVLERAGAPQGERGEANRRRVAAHFSLDGMIHAYARLYDELLAVP